MRKKIAIIVLGNPITKVDGISNFHKQFIEYAKHSKDLSVDYYCATDMNKKQRISKNISVHSIEIKNKYELYPGLYLEKNPFRYIKLIADLAEAFRKEKYFAITISSPDTFSLAAIIAAKRSGIPVLGNYHTDIPQYLVYWFKEKNIPKMQNIAVKFVSAYSKFVYKRCDRIIAPTKKIISYLAGIGHDKAKLAVVSRGVDSKRFVAGKKTAKTVALYVGRISKEKNLQMLTKLAKTDIKLVLVGDGPYKKELQQKLPKATFTEYLSGKELAKQYAKADIFVFPSKTDTFSNVVLEAMSARLPVVGFKNARIADRVKDKENGFLVETEDAFIKAVTKLAKDKDLRKEFGKQANEVAKTYTWESVFTTYLQEFDKARAAYEKRMLQLWPKIKHSILSFNPIYGLIGAVSMGLLVAIGNISSGLVLATKAGLTQSVITFLIVGVNTGIFEVFVRKSKFLAIAIPTAFTTTIATVIHLIRETPEILITSAIVFLTAIGHFSALSFIHKRTKTLAIKDICKWCISCIKKKK